MRERLLAALVPVVIAAAVAVVLLAQPGPAAGTPAIDLLVVQADLQDAVRPADAADTRDLDNFVAALARSAPRPPDALALTEVLGPGARRVARRLSTALRRRYVVAVAPERAVFLPDGAVRESAIIVNRDAVRVLDAGFTRVQSEDQAHALLQRRAGGPTVGIVSAHVNGAPAPAVTALRGLAEAEAELPVIAGDLRNSRCAIQSDDQPVDCLPQAFWSDVTDTHAYSDAFFEASGQHARKLTGYVLARGAVDRAFVDDAPPAACKEAFDAGRSGSAPADCRDRYYADAPFGWALLRQADPVQRVVVPAAVALDHCELGVRRAAIVARVVNNTDATVTDDVSASVDAPLSVAPEQATLEVPPHSARSLALRLTALQATTPTGDYSVSVRVGTLSRDVSVHVPADCFEPRVFATSFHAGFPPENAIDGDINTFWHSEYSPPTPLPQSLTLNLGEPRSVSQLDYQPRFDGNLNGAITAYNVYVSSDGQAFTKVATGTWAADARLKTAAFASVTTRYVRLEATAGNNGSFASAAEVTVK